jgi:tripartite-type tricarboxylate transporter receptor subunit TctC
MDAAFEKQEPASVFRRPILLALALCAGVLGLRPGDAFAQEWPVRPVKLIVPFAPGGGVDFVARVLGPKLSERLGKPVVIENRAGANGVVGLQGLITAQDGHTICIVSAGPLVVNPHMYLKLPYDTLRDFAPIANLVNFPLLLAVHPAALPVKDVKEFIAHARSKPNRVSYSSPGIGNTNHLAGELFASMANSQMLHVPYKGSGPAIAALLSGEVNSAFSSIPTILPHVRSGRIKVIGVGNSQRIPFLPEIPTIAEAGLPGFEAFTWGGMIGPGSMPANVVQQLNKHVVEIFRQKEIADQLLNQGAVPTPSSSEQFAAYIAAELKKWGEIVKMAKIKPE